MYASVIVLFRYVCSLLYDMLSTPAEDHLHNHPKYMAMFYILKYAILSYI